MFLEWRWIFVSEFGEVFSYDSRALKIEKRWGTRVRSGLAPISLASARLRFTSPCTLALNVIKKPIATSLFAIYNLVDGLS